MINVEVTPWYKIMTFQRLACLVIFPKMSKNRGKNIISIIHFSSVYDILTITAQGQLKFNEIQERLKYVNITIFRFDGQNTVNN